MVLILIWRFRLVSMFLITLFGFDLKNSFGKAGLVFEFDPSHYIITRSSVTLCWSVWTQFLFILHLLALWYSWLGKPCPSRRLRVLRDFFSDCFVWLILMRFLSYFSLYRYCRILFIDCINRLWSARRCSVICGYVENFSKKLFNFGLNLTSIAWRSVKR